MRYAKVKMFIPQTLLFALLSIPSAAYADNILLNPGFETGTLGPWFQDRNLCLSPCENWNVTSAAAHSGTFSITDVGNIDIRQNFSATPTSTITQVSLWVEHPDPVRSLDAIDFFYSDGTSSEFLTAFTSTNSWEFFDVTSDLAPGKSLTGFSFFGYNTNPATLQRTFLDDVTINVTTPEPQSLLLLASGLLGFIGFFGFGQWKDHRRPLSAKE